jgi:probable selenium-dependent hydroxylase accessory protein YqeC
LEEGKLLGLSCELLQELADLPLVDKVIVEADGSRGRPLKFPAEYEPVICSPETLIVIVMGVQALGQKLTEQHFHRIELACELMGVDQGTGITAEFAAQVLWHPRSYGKYIGQNRVVTLINQVETPEQENGAWEVARNLLAREGIDRVVIGAVGSARPVRAVIHRGEGELK